jgi:hypothetical protein
MTMKMNGVMNPMHSLKTLDDTMTTISQISNGLRDNYCTDTLEDLATIEQKRIELIMRAKHHTPCKVIASWEGTAVKWVFLSYRMWIAISIFVAVRTYVSLALWGGDAEK